ncbi:MAG: glycosyltransferase family 4 protein [Planctomycetaceae bacterium]
MSSPTDSALRIAVVVHGRFHSFDLARELRNLGHDVTIFTNYSKRQAAQFGLGPEDVVSFPIHRWIGAIFHRLPTRLTDLAEPALHRAFGRWARSAVRGRKFDLIYAFSGVSEELYSSDATGGALRLLVRGSSHIETQHQILTEEERRLGSLVDKPTTWIRQREQREYSLADQIVVLSQFAYDSFIDHGISASKLNLLTLGSELERFRADVHTLKERKTRILSGQPLRILTVGTWSSRKGVRDIQRVARELSEKHQFRFVGTVTNDGKREADSAQDVVQFRPRVPQHELSDEYAWGDVFFFPTLEDGYAVVLAQAYAGGLPILSTASCAAPALVNEGQTGWIRTVRDVEGFVEVLRWCDQNRQELAEMVERVASDFQQRDWSDVARDFSQQMARRLGRC